MELLYSFDPERFCLGTLCALGHKWPGTEQSLRRVVHPAGGAKRKPHWTGNCVGCRGRKQSDWLLSFLDYEAMGWPAGQTLGKVCPGGHRLNGLDTTLRQDGKCIECEKIRKRRQNDARPRRTDRRWHPELRGLPPAERRRLYKRKLTEELRAQGLTARGTLPQRADGAVEKGGALQIRLRQSIRNAGRLPSVAQLVIQEQRRYWAEDADAYREFCKERAKARARWRTMTDPEYVLYRRQKSNRRKALLKSSVGIQLTGRQVR